MPPTPKERAAEQREPRQGGGPTSAENPSPAAAATPESSGERIISLHAGYDCNGRFVDGYMARPRDERPRPGVVMLSGMRGLTWTQRELTRLFARAGFVALSPDYLGRRPKTVAEGLAAKNALSVETAIEQLAAGSRFLKSLPWVGAEGNVGIMGFCLGRRPRPAGSCRDRRLRRRGDLPPQPLPRRAGSRRDRRPNHLPLRDRRRGYPARGG
jgi:hypothetical protein